MGESFKPAPEMLTADSEIPRALQQYWLDVLADLCGRSQGVKITMTLKPETKEKENNDELQRESA